MFDPVSNALRASSFHSGWAVPMLFSAGVYSSAGPCTAPRFIAAAAVTAGRDRRRSAMLVCSIICGLVAAYACFGAVASLLAPILQYSSAVYLVLAVALAIVGVRTLWRGPQHRCAHGKTPENAGMGASFLLGASFAIVVSPCCTPLMAAILTYTSASGDPLYGSILLASFALGHAMPLAAVSAFAHKVTAAFSRMNLNDAAATVAAVLTLALAAYYAVLA